MAGNKESQKSDVLQYLPSDFAMNSFSQATTVTPSTADENLYLADVKRDWCIGIVPHGGYLMSIVVIAVQKHFQLKHANLNQTDLITIHVEFLARSVTGPAEISIHELKIGRQFSTVRAQLLQYPNGNHATKPRTCIEAHVTLGNLNQESQSGGISLPTRPIFSGQPMPPRSSFQKWAAAASADWALLRPAAFKIKVLLPPGIQEDMAHPSLGPSVREHWVQWEEGATEGGDGFQIPALAYLADAFRPLPESYGLVGSWYPTLSCNLQVRKAPSSEKGWQWLFLRIEMRQVKDGRFDLDVLILDEDGDLVALSMHTALIVAATRNSKVIENKL